MSEQTELTGFWVVGKGSNRRELIFSREEAKLPPLHPTDSVWTILHWFNNGTSTMLGTRVNREDVPRVNQMMNREECKYYLRRFMQVRPYEESVALIQDDLEPVLRPYTATGVELKREFLRLPKRAATQIPQGSPVPQSEPSELTVMPLFKE